MKLWLDDERPAPEGWVWVKTVDEAIEAFFGTDDSVNPTLHDITHLSVDHDLGSDERPGYDLLTWLELAIRDGMVDPPVVTVHSMNAGALPRMKQAADAINRYRGRNSG